MDECLSENQLAELVSDAVVGDDAPLTAHLDRCPTCLAAVAAALRAGAPARTSRFAIVRRLGAGGMSTVYEVLDHEHNTRVALKMLRHLAPDNLIRFKREFRALQSLHHPNLVRLGELIAEDDRWSFTMELLEGVSFLEYVRPGVAASDGARFDIARLRHAFRQLVHGLGALHAVGMVHRDVKPSNALVTREGRVVVLDLGLVLDQHSEADSTGGHALGTLAYMAPEQALGHRVGPEADWYAVGVLLYQALTGQLPFAGSTVELAAKKQRGQVVPARALVPVVPAALDELCRALLDPDPAARPGAEAILRALGDGDPAAPATRSVKTAFVGRSHDLAVLSRALGDTRQDRPVAVFVSGESGIGKSALVQRFAEDCRDAGTVVLVGRCYERESVPFKAVDGIVDALSHYLARLPEVDVAAVLPREAALLARAFPVLARVGQIAQAPHAIEIRDPQELRVRVFGALRELFARLADRRPILLVVDDVHWADADSFALLAELFRPPDAPALLLVATVRASAGASERAHIDAARSALHTEVHELHLSRMTADEARALAELLIARHGGPDLDPAAVAEEASGHPLFIDELIRASRADAAAMRLDDALWHRIARLEPAAREILQLAALSGGPLAQNTAALAAHIDGDAFENHLSLLRATNLIRTSGASAGDPLEPYHDRVRAAVLAHTDAGEARVLHRRLALALEAALHADAEALALHWRETGDHERAAEYAAEAAARASRALAFDRAVQLYRLALQLRAGGAERAADRAIEHRQRVELGHALSNAGRGAEAGHVFLAAAETAPPVEAFDLRRLASEQLMRSGHIDEGIGTLRSALRPLGVEVATTRGQTLRSLLVRRARVRLRGLRYRERDARDLPVTTLTRIDFCWSLSACLAFVDPLLGSDLAALHLLLALRAGEPARVVRAVASEAVYAASVGAAERADRLQARARAIAARVDQPYVSGVLGLSSGMVSAFLGRFAEGRRHMIDAQQAFRACATGVAWELDVTQGFEMEVVALMGQLDELRRLVPPALRVAESLDDLYFSTSLRVSMANNLMCLQCDAVDRARFEVDDAMRHWGRSGFPVPDFWSLYSQLSIDLYVGEGPAAHRRLVERWPQLKASMMLRVPYFRIIMLELRARCALAAARQLADRQPDQTSALVAEAERTTRRLRRERVPWAGAHAALLDAGIARMRDDIALAADHLTRAVDALTAADLALYATAARHRLGSLRAGAAGSAAVERASAWFARQGIVAPARMLALLTPAFGAA